MSSFARKIARREARAARRNRPMKGAAYTSPALLTEFDFKEFIANVDFNEPFMNMTFTDRHLLSAYSSGDGTATLQAVPREAHAALGETLHDHHADPQTAADRAARTAALKDALAPFESVTLTRKDVEDPKRFNALFARALRLEDERSAA
ncbi:MAG: hypothetical protein ACI9U2_003803 [Bradymonadia bacterium]|jgi:hypothetical protein